MIIPIRCFECLGVIANKWETYNQMVTRGLTPLQAFEEMKIEKPCCRRMLSTHVDMIDKMLNFSVIQDKLVKRAPTQQQSTPNLKK